MHFITLVAVDIGEYPICNQTDIALKERLEALSAMQKNDLIEKVYLACNISRLRSLTNSFARAVDSAVEYQLEPYCECTENEEYLEFIDETDETMERYDKCVDCIKFSNGTILPAYWINDKFCIKDGLVYQKNSGQLKQDKRTKKAKRMVALPDYPFKKLYKTFEMFADEYLGLNYDEEKKAYGYYCNPNSFWDWYQIGGRWPCYFLVKEDCEEYSPGDYYDELPKPPEGYKWASAARKKDIQWEALIVYKKKCVEEEYNIHRKAFETKELPQDAKFLILKEDGIYTYGRQAVYLDGETHEENAMRRGYVAHTDYLQMPFYCVDDNGWFSEDTCRDGNQECVWLEEVKKFYDNLSDETVLVCVDCHA